MEIIRSRKNAQLRYFRELGRDSALRRQEGRYLCDGEKLLREAVEKGVSISGVLLREGGSQPPLPDVPVYTAGEEAFAYASPLENSPGPLFIAERRPIPARERPERVVVLENVQDPGNVGTVLRTAAALGTDAVILVGQCADPWQPKTVRASMGALFRQSLIETDLDGLSALLRSWELPLWGAALSPEAEDIHAVSLRRAAVAVGNEGRGLTQALLARCTGKLIIPMTPGSESLNAAVAASILMWEMAR